MPDDSIKKTPRFFITVRDDEVFYGKTSQFRLEGFFEATLYSKSNPQGALAHLSRPDLDCFLLPHQFERCILDFPHTPRDVAAIVDDEAASYAKTHPPQTPVGTIREFESISGRLAAVTESQAGLTGVIDPGFGPPRTFPAAPALKNQIGEPITVRREAAGRLFINDKALEKLREPPKPAPPMEPEQCFS
jgi:hypothetical protein